MSRRTVRAGLAALALAVLGAPLLGPAVASAAPGQQDPEAPADNVPTTEGSDEAIDDLVGCVQGSRRLLVLFLVDESASLKNSDPDDRRVDAAQSALDSLLALATEQGDASPEVDVALAAFSNEFRMVQDWTPADADTADELRTSLDSFADLKNGIDTDYVNALSDAQESLASQAAAVTEEGGETPCRAVVLFTDGGYDIAVRETEEAQERLGLTKDYAPDIELTTPEQVREAEAAGRAALCDEGGIADRLRVDRVALLTVALSGSVARTLQLPLAAATTGKADDYTCGTPTERSPGAYLAAEDIDVLIASFTDVGLRLAGGVSLPGEDQVQVCGEDPCDEGTRTFELDQTMRRAQVVSLAAEAGTELEITGPSGERTRISEEGDAEVGGVEASTRSVAGRGWSVELTRPDDAESWDGEWSVSVVDPSGEQAGDPALLRIYVFSDIGVALGESDPLVRGQAATIEATLSVPEGVEAADVVATAEAEVRLTDPITREVQTVALEGPPVGPFTGEVAIPADTTTNSMDAVVEVRMTTTTGAALVSQSADTALLVRRPEGSVQFAPAMLEFPSLTGEGTTTTDLILTAGEKAGCVWFDGSDFGDLPEGMSGVDLTIDGSPLPGEGDCIEVPAGGQSIVTIEAKPVGRASGTVRGSIEILEKVEGAEATTTAMSTRFDVARGVDEARRLLLTVVLLLAGLGLPLLVLLVVNALTARFQRLDVVRGAALPVVVAHGTISRVEGDRVRPFALREGDFASLAGLGDDKSFAFGGVLFRAKASRNPFGGTVAMAAPEGGAQKLKGNAGSKVELDPGLAGSWVFLLDADATRLSKRADAEGLLIAFVAEGDFRTQSSKLLPDIEKRLPETARSLAGLVKQVKVKPSKGKGQGGDDVAADGDEVAGPGDAGGEATGAAADGDAEASASPPAGATDAADGAGAPADEGSPPAAAAPGFTGAASGGAAPPTPPVAAPEVDPDAGPDDDPPSGGPVGFTGAR